jgi:hypothetical protein
VHIPVDLINKITRRREETGWSNGEIVIAALEHVRDQLGELISRRTPAGGGLFAARASRGARLVDGPLTALNIRLYEQDYATIDALVEQYGAFSRGHLISVALTNYLTRDDNSQGRS